MQEPKLFTFLPEDYVSTPDGMAIDSEGNLIFDYYSIQYWVVPLTGWYSNFLYLNKKTKFFKL